MESICDLHLCKMSDMNCTWEKLNWYIVLRLDLFCISGRFCYKYKLHVVLVITGQDGRRRMLLENLDSLVKMGNL